MSTKIHSFTPPSATLSFLSAAPAWEVSGGSAHAAFWTVAVIVRNASLCSCLAWLSTFCFSQGNVLSSTPVGEQSYTSFFSAVLVTTQTLSSIMFILTLAQVLRYQYVADSQERAPSLWFCYFKLARQTTAPQLAVLVLEVLVVYCLSFAPATVRPLKLEFYVDSACNHLFICYADLRARAIIRQETLARRQSTRDRELPTRSLQQPAARKPRSAWSRYWRHFFATFSITMFMLVAGLYVHTTRNVEIPKEAQSELVFFTCASTLFKMCMQELAKWAVHKKQVRDIRLMFVAVAVPTVLIDTQIRLVTQRLQSTQSTIAGTMLLALIEVVMRVSKLGLIKLQIYRAENAHRSSPTVASLAAIPGNAVVATATSDLARWKRSIWKLYMAEVYADMAAEYIAIGCSTSILFFYRTHPKYQLGHSAPSALAQLTVLATQVGLEIVVDFLTSTLEISHGTDFRELRKHGAFILAFFALMTVVNIQISAAVYILS